MMVVCPAPGTSLDWVAPLVTGVVGAAGIAGTYWTGRQARIAAATEAEAQRTSAQNHRIRDEKREAYGGLISGLFALRREQFQIHGLVQTDEAAADAAFETAWAALMEHRARVRLAGSLDVRVAMREVLNNVLDKMQRTLIPGEPFDAIADGASNPLVAAMRADLGYESDDFDPALAEVSTGQSS